jgi:hypothetical protein
MSDALEMMMNSCRDVLDDKMKTLVDYSKILPKERGKFNENDLLHYVHDLENALRDYERAVDEYKQNR